uniref:Uncharacterized protein n=1 Tax=Lepeophtheirus salmonis TaxID=72036 RepID=A0A0K2SYV1_LEPSM
MNYRDENDDEDNGSLKPKRTLFFLSCASLIISNIAMFICLYIIIRTRKQRPKFISVLLGSQYLMFIVTFFLYLIGKCMVDYELQNGQEDYERSYGVIGCMIYFLWSATALNSLVMIAFIQAKKIWKKNWGIFALLFQGICVIIIPSIILGLCIHFNDSGLKSFGAFIDATAYIQGEIWTLNFSNESDYFILLYFILTLIIFLVLGFACLIYNALTTYKDIRVKDMGMPGVAASYQIISSLELNLFKYKVAFVPFGFYMIAGYLFIDSQVSNDYEESRQAYYLIPLAFLLISNVYFAYLFCKISFRKYEVPFLPGIITIGRPTITKLPGLSESTERSMEKYFGHSERNNDIELKKVNVSSQSYTRSDI